jgi:Leucine-rich repeat (LRR) protein
VGVASLDTLFGDIPLRHLSLIGNHITGAGALALANFPQLQSLTSLDLSQNPIGDVGLRHIAGSPYLGNLTSLTLWGCGLSDESVQTLARSFLVHLTDLDLNNNAISAQAVEALRASPHLRQLKELKVGAFS